MALGADHAVEERFKRVMICAHQDGDVQPSSILAITIPLPALADSKNPALKTVKTANPFACSRTVRGMTFLSTINQCVRKVMIVDPRTPSSPLFPLSTNDKTANIKFCEKLSVEVSTERRAGVDCLLTLLWQWLR